MEQNDEKLNKYAQLRKFLAAKFNLAEDCATQPEVMDNIRKGVEFSGTNLWVLIFATFIASLGLNVNSAAVIIGAMLISPLMGPIMGIGLSLGVNDFELMKRSVKNFGFMVLMSILTSTLYFIISPLTDAQSELLARTNPTTYDVLIAFFGGLAGMVAQTRRDRISTVIPGVAIATALMPPLCTAGYGIATGQFSYFVGAFYLFLINTVFIAFATYFVVRFLKYDKKVFLDKRREKQVTRYMAIILFATLVPSVIVGYRLIQKTVFESSADRFITNVVKFNNSQILDVSKTYNRKGSEINIIMIGQPLSQDAIDNMRAQMPTYGLTRTELIIRQPASKDNISFSSLQNNFEQIFNEKNSQIEKLKESLNRYTTDTLPASDISREITALSKDITSLAISKSVAYNGLGEASDTVVLCRIKLKDKKLSPENKAIIIDWLKARTKSDKVDLFIE